MGGGLKGHMEMQEMGFGSHHDRALQRGYCGVGAL